VQKTPRFLYFSYVFPQAYLGKKIIFSINWLQKGVSRTTAADATSNQPQRCDALLASHASIVTVRGKELVLV
jgi:hypothetical protein